MTCQSQSTATCQLSHSHSLINIRSCTGNIACCHIKSHNSSSLPYVPLPYQHLIHLMTLFRLYSLSDSISISISTFVPVAAVAQWQSIAAKKIHENAFLSVLSIFHITLHSFQYSVLSTLQNSLHYMALQHDIAQITLHYIYYITSFHFIIPVHALHADAAHLVGKVLN